MKKKDVRIGGTYAKKVAGSVVPVTITSESIYGGWNGRNEKTGRDVRVKSAASLRGEIDMTSARSRVLSMKEVNDG